MSSQAADAPRTLADQLRGWSDEQLAALLQQRPDLTTPAPQDSTQLASRAATRASVHRALDGLDRLELCVLEAHSISGHTTPDQLVDLVNARPEAVRAASEKLQSLALTWPAPSGLRALSATAEVLASHPSGTSGLRPFSSEPQPPDEIRAHLAEASPQARAMLEHVDSHGGHATRGRARRTVSVSDAASPAEELIARRLLIPREGDTVVLPGEVAVELRGGRTTREPVDDIPDLATSTRDPALIVRSAAGAAFDAVRRVELILDHWGTAPPGVLRGGGLGVRDLRTLARDLHVTEPAAALLVEVAASAGLLAEGSDAADNVAWVPTDEFDRWSAQSVEQRWESLVRAWRTSSRVPSLVGQRDSSGKAWNALSPELSSGLATEARGLALDLLAALPEDQALATGTGTPSLVSRARWYRPRRPEVFGELVAAAFEEAAMLGIVGAGALPPSGRAVAAGNLGEAAELIAGHLPQPVDHVLLQADLTAVAPGPLETEVARRLHLLAEVESRGGATVYRFTPASVRRAFDAGWAAAEVKDFVTSISRTPVPQPLDFLVDDVSRTFGTVRVGHAESFLRSDDEAALAALVHDPRTRTLGLRLLAPTVVISTAPLDVLLPRLRELGAAPVVEAPDGTVRVSRPDLLRARPKRGRRPAGAVEARQVAQVHAVVTAIRAGDRAASSAPARRSTATPSDALAALREAIEARHTVVVSYVDSQGSNTERIVDPRHLEGGRLRAFDHRADAVREFAVHRITSVRPA